jgi:hypothetical protein
VIKNTTHKKQDNAHSAVPAPTKQGQRHHHDATRLQEEVGVTHVAYQKETSARPSSGGTLTCQPIIVWIHRTRVHIPRQDEEEYALKEPQPDYGIPRLERRLCQPFICTASTKQPQPYCCCGTENLVKVEVSTSLSGMKSSRKVLDADKTRRRRGS